MDRDAPSADHRLHYGPGEFQFGDLWLPRAAGESSGHPLVVFLHGGWWRSAFDLAYGGHLSSALRAAGVAVWSIEYRRVGNPGGGWPGTFEDVAAGFGYLPAIAKEHRLDLRRVVAAGHSAGGHLAFWLAGRHHVPKGSAIDLPRPPIALRGVIGLAGSVDLRLTIDLSAGDFAHDKREVERFMGGSPTELPDRYRAGNPGDLLPLNLPQVLLQGTNDGQIPPDLPRRWAADARRQGDPVTVVMLPEADHFDVVDPLSNAWPAVKSAILRLL